MNSNAFLYDTHHSKRIYFWATVCKTVRPMLSDRCLSVCLSCPFLSVTLMYCGQTVGRIKMKLGLHVGFGSDYIVLDGNPGRPPPKGQSPQFSAHVYSAQCPNGWMDQDATW